MDAPAVSESAVAMRRTVLLLTLAFAGIFVLATGSIQLRPHGVFWSVWWPAIGVAVGVVSRYPRAKAAIACSGVAIIVMLANVGGGRSIGLAVGIGIVNGIEAFVASRVLRTAAHRVPRLDSLADLIRLFGAVFADTLVVTVFGGINTAIFLGPSQVLTGILSAVPNHAAGVLLVTPLFLVSGKSHANARLPERLVQWLVTIITVLGTFGGADGWPVAFLVLGPLIWGATRLSRTEFLWQMIFTATAASAFSTFGLGTFGFANTQPAKSALMVQVFDLLCGIVFFTVMVLVEQQRRLAEAMSISERLFRQNFDGSLVGMAVVSRVGSELTLDRVNRAGRELLGAEPEGPADLQSLLSRESFTELVDAGREAELGSGGWGGGALTTGAGRTLEVSLSRVSVSAAEGIYSVQFIDITDRVRLQQLAIAEMQRAGEVQRALRPREVDPFEGFTIAGACVPTAEVGGDFYDWYEVTGGLAITLGDVMGKGVGAGMIAATLRGVLRSDRRHGDARAAVTRAAQLFDSDLAGSSTFVTLFHARLRSQDGRVSYTDAGHGLSMILRTSGDYVRLTSGDLPLGAMPNSAWTRRSATLGPGDMLVGFSDGVLDLYDGTLSVLDHIAELGRRATSPAEFVEFVIDRAKSMAAPDDVSVVAVQRNWS